MSGGFILLWLTGFSLSVAVWVGFIALFGIAVDDGILMVHYLQKNLNKTHPKTKQILKNAL